MKAVVDSSSLVALARVGYLWILEKTFKHIIIPEAVYNEVVAKGTDKAGVEEIKKANWIDLCKVRDKESVSKLVDKLHQGESETIVLAEEIDADVVILDEELARQIAKKRGLRVTGTLVMLVEAKKVGLISSVTEVINKLEAEQFFIRGGI